MNAISNAAAREACEALCHAYGAHADAGEADALANLYTPDGVFDRLGQPFIGRAAIAQVIAGRAAGVWTRHRCHNIRIEVAADGQSATGQLDLDMQRGSAGIDKIDEIRAEYFDQFVLTAEGWRIKLRKVVMRP